MNSNPMNFLMQMMNMGNNPQAIVQQMVNQNPQMQVALNQFKNSGMTPKQYVMQYAKQSGIDLSPIISMMNGRGIKM